MAGPTHVIVLAAGKGSRLGALGARTPKWLLRVGEATIADRQLEAIAAAREAQTSIASVRVVCGHAATEIDSYLEHRPSDGVSALFNPDYARCNNWYSVLIALRELDPAGDARVAIVNGDLFARPAWLARFLADAAITEAESLVGIDLERKLTEESMKVSLDPGPPPLVRAIGKVGVEDAAGEYVGLLMARGAVLEAFRRRLESFVGRAESVDEWYERALGLSAGSGVPWTAWATPDSAWVEIDDDSDYEAAVRLAASP